MGTAAERLIETHLEHLGGIAPRLRAARADGEFLSPGLAMGRAAPGVVP